MSPRHAEFLLINNNNTRTKFALASRESLLDHRYLLTKEVTVDSVRQLLDTWEYERVVLASVVPKAVPSLLASIEGLEHIELTHQVNLGITIDFPDPTKIGADRLANAVAVSEANMERPVIVVDFGTAVTFDIIDQRPAYVGGVIAPGLDAMRYYLHERTALLPQIDIDRPASAIGKSTIHAMQSGAYHGYRGLVIEILRRIENELGSAAKVIATGGYASLIAEDLSAIESVDPTLTMRGLLRVANLNFPS